jgi:L-iditol 2-dehydrogenase
MRAAVYRGPGEVRIESLEDPRPGPGEVLVRMLACGICGSDLMQWYVSRKAPVVLGHEPVGVVVEVGEGKDGNGNLPPVGARVAVHHHVPCFVCDRCRRGHHTLCAAFKRAGIRPGGFSELILVTAEPARRDLLVVPDHLSTRAATLVEPLACCLRGQRAAGVGRGTRLAVVGAGQMGLLQVQAAKAGGCLAVVAVEPVAERRKLAESFGAAAAEPDPSAVVAALGARPDVVIVCSGAPAAFDLATTVVDDGGVVQLFAPTTPGCRFDFDPNDLFFRELTLQASYSAGPMDTREALDLLAGGAVTAEGIVTHRFPLWDVARALEMAGSGEAIKVIVEGE